MTYENPPKEITFDKPPPQDLDAERSVLGAMLLNEDAIPEVFSTLKDGGSKAFYAPAHQCIFDAMSRLVDRKKPLDGITIKKELESTGDLETAGGLAYISELTGSVPTSANVEHYAIILRDCQTLREVLAVAHESMEAAHNPPQNITELTDSLQARMKDIAAIPEETLKHIAELTPEFREHISKVANGLIPPGLPTGMPDMDQLTGGLRPGNFMIAGARPSVGKTAFAVNVATKLMRIKKEARIVIFSMEMTTRELLGRICTSLNSVNFKNMEVQLDVDQNMAAMDEAIRLIDSTNLYIDDTSNPKIEDVARRLRSFKSSHGNPDMVIVDYVQLMSSTQRHSNRSEEVSHISRTMKVLSKEMDCPFIVLSQFNRESSKQNTRPYMHQLKESGSLEQDADIILILHPSETNPNVLWAYLDKQRNGPVGEFALNFNKKFQYMESMSKLQAGLEVKHIKPTLNGMTKVSEVAVTVSKPIPEAEHYDDGDGMPF